MSIWTDNGLVSRNAHLIDEVLEDLGNIRWGFQKAIEIQSGVSTVEEVLNEQATRNQEKGPDLNV